MDSGGGCPHVILSKRVCFVIYISLEMLDWIADDDSRIQTHFAKAFR